MDRDGEATPPYSVHTCIHTHTHAQQDAKDSFASPKEFHGSFGIARKQPAPVNCSQNQRDMPFGAFVVEE